MAQKLATAEKNSTDISASLIIFMIHNAFTNPPPRIWRGWRGGKQKPPVWLVWVQRSADDQADAIRVKVPRDL